MKIVVIGGTGRIGSKVAERLCHHGHEPVAASPNTGVNTITGEGVAEALAGRGRRRRRRELAVVRGRGRPGVLLDVHPQAARRRRVAGVGHHVALSRRADLLPDSGYPRPRSPRKSDHRARVPYSIVRATQFFEFTGASPRPPPR